MAFSNFMDDFCQSKFWDANVTWYTDDPDFTYCFQRTFLVWLPCLFLWLFVPIEVVGFYKSRNGSITWTSLNLAKIIISLTLAVLSLVEITYVNFGKTPSSPVDSVAAAIQLVTYLLVLVLVYLGKKYGIITSALLFLFWLLATLCGFLTYWSILKNLHMNNYIEDTVMFTLYMVQYPLVLSMFALTFLSDEVPQYRKHYIEYNAKESPEATASFPSKIYFSWFTGFIFLGWKRPLVLDDMYELSYSDKSSILTSKFEKQWLPATQNRPKVYKFDPNIEETELNGVASDNYEKKRTSQPKTKASVIPAMIKTYWTYFLATAFARLVFDLLTFTNPVILRWLIEYVSSDEPIWKGYYYVMLLFGANVVQGAFSSVYVRRCVKLGLRVRSMSMAVIYKKVLRLSNVSRRNLTMGVILNTMSVDASRLVLVMMEINLLWSAPLKIALSLYFLYEVIGPAVFAGLAIIIILMPLEGYLARLAKKLQTKLMNVKDLRVKLMSEILNGIKVLKLYGWEKSFQEKILELREREMVLLRRMAYLNASTISLWLLAPFIVSVVSFAVFVLSDENNVLTATTAFVSLRLFNMLKDPLNDLPDTINTILVGAVSINRINRILNSEELVEYVEKDNTGSKNVIDVSNASFRWDEDGPPLLKNINLKVPKGGLVAVVGQVGCGKSSLISAILGDMDKIEGKVKARGSVAYVPQQAWIRNATLQNNILFGNAMDLNKYQEIIRACTLDVDFEILPAGDQTEIGEKGINLSGGQKQRVSLARAVYRDSDIVLLDDPLGAVDSHVGKHIFDKVIGNQGILKDKTRILVTHSVTFLPEVDFIVVMKNGEISEIGSYQEIIASDGAFKDFLAQHMTEDIQEDDEEYNVLAEIIGRKHPEILRQVSQISRASKTKSNDSLAKVAKEEKRIQGKELVKAEIELRGGTPWAVYKQYIQAMNVVWCVMVLVGIAAQQGFGIGSNYWLSIWSNDADRNDTDNDTALRDMRLGIYCLLGCCQTALLLGSMILLAVVGLRASNILHFDMLNRVLHSPMSFFDTTPMGRVLNRFSKDVDSTDSEVGRMIRRFLVNFIQIIGGLVAIIIEIPWFIVAAMPIALLYAFVQRVYLATNRQLKRMEANSRSPLYSHFSETLSGVSTIRAYGAVPSFVHQSEKTIDNNHKLLYFIRAANRWLSCKLDLVGSLILFFAALLVIISKGSLKPSSVGFIITSANSMISLLLAVVISSVNLETMLVSVERVSEYTALKTEAAWEKPETKPASSWPNLGRIVFQNYSSRYREGLDLVLRNISFTINPSEKVGVVGRTGAGKSSLTLGLFRVVEPATGSIIIDGIDIATLGLFDLRSKLTIIPQDPVLFSGKLRINLDPFGNHTDDELWTVLEISHLKSFVQTIDQGLDYEIAEGGENLSVGQRQLICLARALLRKTKILVLDEATASVDLDTDDLIQATIRKEFKDCTVVTIAHRLNTVMDYDRVMVLDMGTISEFDTPSNLLQNNKSIFFGMAKDAGLV